MRGFEIQIYARLHLMHFRQFQSLERYEIIDRERHFLRPIQGQDAIVEKVALLAVITSS